MFGMPVDKRKEHGVGCAVRNTLLQPVEVRSDGNERVTTLRFKTKKGTATIVSVYAHTVYSWVGVRMTQRQNDIVRHFGTVRHYGTEGHFGTATN